MFVLITQDEVLSKNERIEALLLRLSTGEQAALGGLYEIIKTDIYAFALSKTENVEDAEDAMQDAFVRIYKYAKLYVPKGTPMSWIFTIVMNIIKRQRSLKSRHISLDDTIGETVVDERESFEEGVIKSDFIKMLMRTLDEDERQIVIMHAVSGLKHREIAKILDSPLSTVLSRYNRAIKKLQKQEEGGSL